jgi:hypothetical protein
MLLAKVCRNGMRQTCHQTLAWLDGSNDDWQGVISVVRVVNCSVEFLSKDYKKGSFSNWYFVCVGKVVLHACAWELYDYYVALSRIFLKDSYID